MNMTTSSIPTITLDAGNQENLVGKRGSNLVGGGNIGIFWQLPEDPGEIKVGIAMGKFEQHPVYDFTRELLGFVSK
jgi:hypothetical protein